MTEKKTDRSLSFHGIDGDGNARRITMMRRYIDDPVRQNLGAATQRAGKRRQITRQN